MEYWITPFPPKEHGLFTVSISCKAMAKIHIGCQKKGWLFWYEENYVRYPTPTEIADIATAAQTAIEQKNNALRKRLREFGVDPDSIE